MTWKLTVAIDLMLPLEVERRTEAALERTTLVSVFPLSAAPWAPVAAADYELIDFADLGDRASDPFVARVESRLGLGHEHTEEH
jgi:hypothetical protein